MPAFYTDDNSAPLVDAAGLVSSFTTAGTVTGTSSASVQEIALGADFSATASKSFAGGKVLVRLASTSADVYYAFGAAGASGSFSSANMAVLPQRWVETLTLEPSRHASLYILQVTAPGPIWATVLR